MRSSCFVVLLLVTLTLCVQGDNAHRNLKGSGVTNGMSDEERIQLPSFVEKAVAYLKGSSAYTKLMKKNPSIAKTVAENPSIAKNVQAMAKDEKLVETLKKTKALEALTSSAKKNPKAAEAAAERFGMTLLKRVRKIELIGDVKGMAIAYTILFLALIGIGATGAVIYNNVRNSYIH